MNFTDIQLQRSFHENLDDCKNTDFPGESRNLQPIWKLPTHLWWVDGQPIRSLKPEPPISKNLFQPISVWSVLQLRFITAHTVTNIMETKAVRIRTGVGVPTLVWPLVDLPLSDLRGGPFQAGLSRRRGEVEIERWGDEDEGGMGVGKEEGTVWTKKDLSFIAVEKIQIPLIPTKPRLDWILLTNCCVIESYITPMTGIPKSVNKVKDMKEIRFELRNVLAESTT